MPVHSLKPALPLSNDKQKIVREILKQAGVSVVC